MSTNVTNKTLPQYLTEPSFVGILCGSRGSGKSTALTSLLRGPYRGLFSNLFLFSPTAHLDPCWAHLHIPKSFSEYNEEALDMIHKNSSKENPSLIVLDDCLAENSFKRMTADSALNRICIRGRHKGVSLLITTQHLHSISTIVRQNVDFVLFLSPTSDKSTQALFEEYAGVIPKTTFKQMIAQSTERPYGCFIINLKNRCRGLPVYFNNDKPFEIKTDTHSTDDSNAADTHSQQ